MSHVKNFDNGIFQVYTEDEAQPYGSSNIYFMFGMEYSFSMESLVAFLQFLLSTGILDDIQVNAASNQKRLA